MSQSEAWLQNLTGKKNIRWPMGKIDKSAIWKKPLVTITYVCLNESLAMHLCV